MWWHTRRNQISSFRRNGRVRLNRQGRQFSRLLAAEVCASVVLMLDIPCSEVVWRVLATHSIRQFPLHFPSLASPCAITFQLDSTCGSLCTSGLRTSLPTYDDRCIGRGRPLAWPPRSPDITPMGFFLWGYIKALIFTTPFNSEEDYCPIVKAVAS